MNYYIQGDAAKADQIKAAFGKLGYDTSRHLFNAKSILYFTLNSEIRATTCNCTPAIIKTHPDYKELELPVEPKFKVGDWIVKKDGNTFYGGNYAEQITLIEVDEKGKHIWFPSKTWIDEDYIRLWTIADAKDGDVITNGKLIVIFNKLEEPTYKQHIIAYVGLDLCGRLQITEDTWQLGVDKAMPATKEQRRRLFTELKKVGYEWDADKKELKKIPPHYDILNFKPFDKVLCRGHNRQAWRPSLYGSYDTTGKYPMFICATANYLQCIPFNEDTKHLLGTTDMCDEQYINWQNYD